MTLDRGRGTMSVESEYAAGSGASLLIVVLVVAMIAIAVWGKPNRELYREPPYFTIIITDENIEQKIMNVAPRK